MRDRPDGISSRLRRYSDFHYRRLLYKVTTGLDGAVTAISQRDSPRQHPQSRDGLRPERDGLHT